jgi:hypothetical protein
MTVMTRLIATVAEIDLQRFKSPTAQPRKVGMSEEGKGSVHRWLENQGTGLASRAPLFRVFLNEYAKSARREWRRSIQC